MLIKTARKMYRPELIFKCRSGATQVTAIEISSHMCETAIEVLCQNGFTPYCTVINEDARKLRGINAIAKRSQQMLGKADVCIFEVLSAYRALRLATQTLKLNHISD